ncbi:MAG: hypothetical protein BWY63_01398 [Chloroflexi bacterium ADurb.Bin360]|nr:MAG: hypothetical protein BWY63_01398 [Chloroflexi bacterium ADurb.Bin360]
MVKRLTLLGQPLDCMSFLLCLKADRLSAGDHLLGMSLTRAISRVAIATNKAETTNMTG